MSGFDANLVHTVPILGDRPLTNNLENASDTERLLLDFLLQYRVGGQFVYRDQLRANLLLRSNSLEVDLRHVALYNEDLAYAVQNRPGDILPLFEAAAAKAAKKILYPVASEARDEDGEKELPEVQIMVKSGLNMLQFRDLTADTFTKLVRIPGIVISTSTLQSRATKLHLKCRSCGSIKIMHAPPGLGGVGGGFDKGLPRVCDAPTPDGQKKECPMDPYMIIHPKCNFVDHQTMKLQEAPDMVPVGELPKHMLLSVDRQLTNKVIPGTRVIATGIFSTFAPKGKSGKGAGPALRSSYLRVCHLELSSGESVSEGGLLGGQRWTAAEEEDFAEMSRYRDEKGGIFERFARSVAPSIYDIKKSVACLLMGGSRKMLPDGMRLRGDINVLLLGDPGTAKSQLLKFVEKVAPIAVYTSGKGSSAAGLTAVVQRDPISREFYLEGGAMVIADGGVVCIDEFDKMRDEDRVAIHEAMEQQTISIAKAGITTVLNSRTSVLAAANPVWGRYNDEKSPGENIDFQTTILSRFDMIFIVRDEHNEARDRAIAKHVIDLQMNRRNEEEVVGEIEIEKMKRYITYCKAKCAPRLSAEAAAKLSDHFVVIRKQIQTVERDNNERSSIPITVRQLEAIIRISESIAKIALQTSVQPHHVDEAIRLFKISTMDAVSVGSAEGLSRGQIHEEMTAIEKEIRKRLPIGWTTSYQSLVKEFVNNQNYSAHALERTLFVMEKSEVIKFQGQRKVVCRIGV
ncbi:minichromosome maintenance protein 5 [Serendipita sp. 398]|nr:minichromosome maintenance protein 5 [Serendipita sp. 398]